MHLARAGMWDQHCGLRVWQPSATQVSHRGVSLSPSCAWDSKGRWLKALVPCTHMSALEEAPGSRPQPGPTLAIAAIMGSNQWTQDVSPPFSLPLTLFSHSYSNSAFQINKSIFKKGMEHLQHTRRREVSIFPWHLRKEQPHLLQMPGQNGPAQPHGVARIKQTASSQRSFPKVTTCDIHETFN